MVAVEELCALEVEVVEGTLPQEVAAVVAGVGDGVALERDEGGRARGRDSVEVGAAEVRLVARDLADIEVLGGPSEQQGQLRGVGGVGGGDLGGGDDVANDAADGVGLHPSRALDALLPLVAVPVVVDAGAKPGGVNGEVLLEGRQGQGAELEEALQDGRQRGVLHGPPDGGGGRRGGEQPCLAGVAHVGHGAAGEAGAIDLGSIGYNDAESRKLGGIVVVRLPTDNRALIDLLEPVKTPALVYDESRLECTLAQALVARELAGVKLLYAVKAAALPHVLEYLSPHLDGFSVSSPFEAHLVKDLFPDATTHFTSPGIRPDEISELRAYCDFVSFNSRTQLERHGVSLTETASLGVRVNTGISKVSDPRYDPCRPGSKLGVPVVQLEELLVTYPRGLDGLHIHTNSDSDNFEELFENVKVLCDALPKSYAFKWVNLGGGYLFEDASLEPLAQAVKRIKDRFGAQVYIEPGAGLVRAAGYLVGSVLDTLEVDGRCIAVLDTTVNHMPEVLEFDYQPDVMNQVDDSPFEYILAGSTCLAGDVFGTYKLRTPLEVGQKVIFEEAGAYSLAKAHRFNGVNLPCVGILDRNGRYRVVKSFDYQNFVSYWKTDE